MEGAQGCARFRNFRQPNERQRTVSESPMDTYTGRGLMHSEDRRAYNIEARRIDWPYRVCDDCGCETRNECAQSNGGAAGWVDRNGWAQCGPCRSTENTPGWEIRTAKAGRSVKPFLPGEDMQN